MTNGPCADVLEIVIKDQPSLHAAYMSFLRNRGLFISTTQGHELRDEVQLLLTLLREPAAFHIKGRVV
jgi:Tfp pilus assembly protein PilZ